MPQRHSTNNDFDWAVCFHLCPLLPLVHMKPLIASLPARRTELFSRIDIKERNISSFFLVALSEFHNPAPSPYQTQTAYLR